MCHQTGGLVGAELERAGIRSVMQVFVREVAEKVRMPRALWVPFEHGHALGEPDNPSLQLSVLRQTFALLDEPGPGPVLRDYVPERAGVAGDAS
jgi:hypothetical protein